ncbi:MAG TPA: hypothetical protein DDW76_02175 [Cyanobacteria bacterium UBA11369]|nr:hypothetical protein [Cyanobacteria bacterium UBA11371]HBE32892.1 hypothetical protein [Cyanobacteria bacterium UBA11368]HBE47636.1 hypothetical protein [Cyanobacteria bacterium UBA11369]
MDSLQNQIIALNHKVDALYQIIEQLSHKLSEVLSEVRLTAGSSTDGSPLKISERRYSALGNSRLDTAFAHKDVLVDTNYLDAGSTTREKELSPEIQIQRLTAQLTAAYNRIAALEEQLLAQRVH